MGTNVGGNPVMYKHPVLVGIGIFPRSFHATEARDKYMYQLNGPLGLNADVI